MTQGAPSWPFRLGRRLLGVVFLVAAGTKVSAPQDFADAVAAYHLLPVEAVNTVALSLPWFELLCGVSLTLGIFPGTGLLGALGLLGVFTGALLLAEVRGLHPACGCFGAISWLEAPPPLALTRDLILFLAGLAAYRAQLTLSVPLQARGQSGRRNDSA